MSRQRWWIAVGLAIAGLFAVVLWPRDYCRSAHSRWGIKVKQCPEGTPRQLLKLRGLYLARGATGKVYVSARALYTVATADTWREIDLTDFSVDLDLVDSAGTATAIEPKQRWKYELGERWAEVVLPQVPDGDYRLRATVHSRLTTSSVDLAVPLYTPARVHVLTDRPLYEPGNTVLMRALVLRARDLAPIDARPGSWVVTDPDGQVVLEEKAPAGDWGVVAGHFPLDGEARTGDWSVTWRSNDAEDTVSFKVQPFTLPRFTVEASPAQPFYRAGDRPEVSGTVAYASGAPVGGATIDVTWNVTGDWPPPASWTEGDLPRQVVTKPDGRFTMTLPRVPADLRGQVHLVGQLAAVDPAGDRVESSTSVLLSEDAIQVQAITELAGGLVEGLNNRLYLRVTTADGRALPGAEINVRRAWSRSDPGIDSALDADSVARIQIDPGPPVNVVIPPLPVRTSPRGDLVSLESADELIGDDGVSIADQVAIERWLKPLERCAKWAEDGSSASVLLRVADTGAIADGETGGSPLGRCVLTTLRGRRLPAGPARMLSLDFGFQEPELPSLSYEITAPMEEPEQLDEIVGQAAMAARDCLPRRPVAGEDEDEQTLALAWRVRAGSKRIEVSWIRDRDHVVPAALARCIDAPLTQSSLSEPAESNQLGFISYTLEPAEAVEPESRPQPTIMQGYELRVGATVDGEQLGTTKLRMHPGSVPELRLRATPVLAAAGDEVALELIRGPGYSGELPEKLTVEHRSDRIEVDIDRKKRTAEYALPADAEGWYTFTAGSGRAVVYARSAADLAVTVAAEEPSYRPGDTATLAVHTEIAGQGGAAAVGLFGVDQSLGQIVSLPDADALRRVRPEVEMRSGPAFGVLDAQALALGRIRGPAAAEATILQVSHTPYLAALDAVYSGTAETRIDPVAELTDRFYPVLAELHAQTRAWEASAPADELMHPATMARLWERALDAVKARGGRIDDSFGRRLRLHRLPYDLLELTDPRQVVVVGTRLPEDVENWTEWVMRRKP